MLSDRIKTINTKEKFRELIKPFLNRLKDREDVLAVIILGGLSNYNERNHADEFSDIDITIVFDNEEKCYYAPNFEFYIYDDDNNEIEVNVHQMTLAREINESWDNGKKEAYAGAEYYYLKDGKVKDFIDEKIRISDEYRKKRLALIAGQYKWFVEINPLRAIKRGINVNAHDLLNRGIDLFIEALYLYNYKYVPHNKWRFEQSKDLNFTPCDYSLKLENALINQGIDDNSILVRRQYIIDLFKDLNEAIVNEYQMSIDELYHYACISSYNDRQLLNQTYADSLLDELKFLNKKEKTLLSSFVNFYVIGNDSELLSLNEEDVEDKYSNIYKKIVKIKKGNL